MDSELIPILISVFSAIIAAASLVLSIKVYKRDTPRLEIEISEPEYECFFGDVEIGSENRVHNYRIAGLYFTLKNLSNVNIEVYDMYLKIKGEKFRLIPSGNPFWEDVPFIYHDSKTGLVETDYNYSINYKELGFYLPKVIESFRSFSGYALFYSFPASIKGKVKAQIVVHSTAGTIKKDIVLLEYDGTFAKQEWVEIEQYMKSQGEMK